MFSQQNVFLEKQETNLSGYLLYLEQYGDQGSVVQNLMKLLANDVKIFIWKYGKYIDIFCWKNVSSFCIAKATHIFAAKTSMYMYLKIP